MSEKITKKSKAADTPDRLIYCGPSLPNGMLNRYSVYKNGIPIHLKSVYEKSEALRGLLVSVSKFSNVEKKLGELGSEERRLFQKIEEEIKRGDFK